MRFQKQAAPVAILMALSLMIDVAAQAAPKGAAAQADTPNLVAKINTGAGTIEVQNLGGVGCCESTTRVTYEFRSGLTHSIYLKTFAIPAGESVTWSVNVGLERGATPLRVCVEADCGAAIAESDEADNAD